MRSDRTKKWLERMPHRALYYAAGVPQPPMRIRPRYSKNVRSAGESEVFV